MTRYVLILLLAASAQQGLAEDKAPVAPPAPPTAASPYYAVPATANTATITPSPIGAPYAIPHAQYAATVASGPFTSLSKLDNLRLAEGHLRAAGLSDEAEHVRQLASKEAAKERANSKNESIVVKFCMLELPLSKLDELSSEKYGGSKDMTLSQFLSKLQASQFTDSAAKSPSPSDDRLWTLFQALRKDGLASQRAAPTVMTTPGQQASVFVGGQLACPTKNADGTVVTVLKEYGTRADVLANLASDGRIHLDVGLRVSHVVPAGSSQVAEDLGPIIKTCEVKGPLDLRSGQTVLIGGGVETREETINGRAVVSSDKPAPSDPAKEVRKVGERFMTFVLVKAEVATKETAAKAVIEK
jgi:hypothetical protein